MTFFLLPPTKRLQDIKKFRYSFPAILWATFVTVITLIPGKDLPHVDIISFDKFGHFGVFGLLNALFLRWNYATRIFGLKSGANAGLVTGIIIAYSGLIEILQGAFYTDRTADIYDFIANSAGCLVAFLLLLRFPRLRR